MLKVFTFDEAVIAAEVKYDDVDGVSMLGAIIAPELFRRAEEAAGGLETTECGLPAAAIVQAELNSLHIDTFTGTIPFMAYYTFDVLQISVGYRLTEEAILRALDGYLLTDEEYEKIRAAFQNFLECSRALIRKAVRLAEAEVEQR